MSSLEDLAIQKGLSAEIIKLKKIGPNTKTGKSRRFSSAILHGTNWHTDRHTRPKNISFKIIILDALILLL